MSNEFQLSLSAHPNIYSRYRMREFDVYFSTPDQGVNESTGLLLLIPGFGGNAESNVYKKMRSVFADQYNLVTVQCNYFGQEFMQQGGSIELDLSVDTLRTICTPEEMTELHAHRFDSNKILEICSN